MQKFATSPNLVRTDSGVSVALICLIWSKGESMKFYFYTKQAAAKNLLQWPRHNISLKQSVFNSNSVTGVTANIRSLVLTVSTQFYWMEGGYWWCHWCFCKYMFLGSYFLILLPLHSSTEKGTRGWQGVRRGGYWGCLRARPAGW